MSKTDEIFQQALIGKKIPILTLDNKWHKLFTQQDHTSEIKRVENELNKLLKRQGKVNEESREFKKLKKKTMDEIVVLADEMGKAPSKKLEKKMEDYRRTLNECNEKIDAAEEEMVELPRQINQLNNRLMLATMDVCYRKMKRNTQELEEIEAWISNVRRELKKKVIRKQEKEAMNHQLYSYMHDIFGADVLEIFDMKYDPEDGQRRGKDEEDRKTSKDQESLQQNGSSAAEQEESGEDALKS